MGVAMGLEAVSEARRLRDAFGRFATGVAIVTTRAPSGQPVGFTLNGLTSVSLDPPLLLVTVGLGAGCLPSLESSGCFAVNVLRASQKPLADRFTQRGIDRFEQVPFEFGETGAPILKGCIANFECVTEKTVDAGDHRIFIARIEKLACDVSGDPLMFFAGKYIIDYVASRTPAQLRA
jgi:flavin reductase (DIM6/NTAB) family NADH-FMN oxidoreductase RutF